MKRTTLGLLAICMTTALCAQLSTAQQTDQTQSRTGRASQAGNVSSLHASKLIGAEVKSNNGEKLGKLEDIVIDAQTGRATFAVIGKGGVLKLGEKRLPVPWQALRIDSEKQVTLLNADKDKLASAPTMQSDTFSDLDNQDFVVVVYKFYEIPVPAAGAGETPGGSQSNSSQSNDTQPGSSTSQPQSKKTSSTPNSNP